MSLRKQIDERDQLIQFLREEYAKAVGQDLPVPPRWEGIAGLPVGPYVPGALTTKPMTKTFAQTISDLSLPKPPAKKTKRDSPRKPVPLDETHPGYKFTTLQLNDFKDKVSPIQDVPREEIASFLHSARELPRLFSLEMTNNGLSDLHAKDLEELTHFKRLKRLDLSNNTLGKAALMQLLELMKGESVLDWLDISYNAFGTDTTAVISLGNVVKSCQSLVHLRVSVGEASCEAFVRNLLANKRLTSIGLPNSKLTNPALSSISQNLGDKKNTSHLAALDLSSCFLTKPAIAQMCEALKFNRSLTKLDLSSNGIASETGRLICEALDFNFSITILKLGNNELGDNFAKTFARTLKNNQILWECDMARNPITDEGAVAVQAVLACENGSLARLGDLDELMSISVLVREELRSLLSSRNPLSSAVTSATLSGSLLPAGDYPLLRPIEVSNASEDLDWQPWNLLGTVKY